VAEEAGLLTTIDEWVLLEAISQAKTWTDGLAVTDFEGIAINVTARQLSLRWSGSVALSCNRRREQTSASCMSLSPTTSQSPSPVAPRGNPARLASRPMPFRTQASPGSLPPRRCYSRHARLAVGALMAVLGAVAAVALLVA